MKNMSTMFVLTMLQVFLLSSGAPVGIYWKRFIETGTVTPNLVNLTIDVPQPFPFTFASPKADNNYAYALAISQFREGFNNSNFFFMASASVLNQNSQTSTGMTLLVSTAKPTFLVSLKIRYLIIQSNFSYIEVLHVQESYTSPYPSYTQDNPLLININSSSYHHGNDTVSVCLNSFKFQCNGSRQVAIQVVFFSVSFGSIMTFHVKTWQTYVLNSLINVSFDMVIYHKQYLKDDYFDATFTILYSSNTNQNQQDYATGANSSQCFYSISKLSNGVSQNSLNFMIDQNGNSVKLRLQNTYVIMKLFCFYSQITCPTGNYWSNADFYCKNCTDQFGQCSDCNDSTCFTCSNNSYAIQDSVCVTCDTIYPECSECDSSSCLNCTQNYTRSLSGNNSQPCVLCDVRWPDCLTCDNSQCASCAPLYILNSSAQCEMNCSLINNCVTCQINSTVELECTNCSLGLVVINGECQAVCGDGIFVADFEECDDGNFREMDGCSSQCQIEANFSCDNSGNTSVCQLTEMTVTALVLKKTEGKNEVVLTLELSPTGVVFYDRADWTKAFINFSHDLSANQAIFDPETGKLRIAFAYNQDLQGKTVNLQTNFSLASSSLNISTISLSLPSKTINNQALYQYSDMTYMIATAVQYLSIAVAAVSLLMMIVGYFGCKLQSLEGVAVVQVSALLLMTLENTGPTFDALSDLSYSLGITFLMKSKQYYQESSDLPIHLRTLIASENSNNLVNIFFVAIIIPLLTSLILKFLSKIVFKDNYVIERSWKYALGTFSYYGMLFLAYGEFACFALSVRYFKADLSCFLSIGVGAVFTIMLAVWVIVSMKYPLWFGCFKQKFRKFQLASYFYFISTIQRFLTASILSCLSPGIISVTPVCAILIAESIFVAVNQPYVLGQWQRPLMNKIFASTISLLYVGANLTSADSMINQLIPLGIIVILLAVLTVSVIASVYELKEFWQVKREKAEFEEKGGPQMSIEQAQTKIMRDFEIQLMPTLSQSNQIWRPYENNTTDADRWKWDQYPILNTPGQRGKLIQHTKALPRCDSDEQPVSIVEKEKTRFEMYAEI